MIQNLQYLYLCITLYHGVIFCPLIRRRINKFCKMATLITSFGEVGFCLTFCLCMANFPKKKSKNHWIISRVYFTKRITIRKHRLWIWSRMISNRMTVGWNLWPRVKAIPRNVDRWILQALQRWSWKSSAFPRYVSKVHLHQPLQKNKLRSWNALWVVRMNWVTFNQK